MHHKAHRSNQRVKPCKALCNKTTFGRKLPGINAVLLFSGRGKSRQNCLGLTIRSLKPERNKPQRKSLSLLTQYCLGLKNLRFQNGREKSFWRENFS